MESFDVFVVNSANMWIEPSLRGEGCLRAKMRALGVLEVVEVLRLLMGPTVDVASALVVGPVGTIGWGQRELVIQPRAVWDLRDAHVLQAPAADLTGRQRLLREQLQRAPRTYSYSAGEELAAWRDFCERLRQLDSRARSMLQRCVEDPKRVPLWVQDNVRNGRAEQDYKAFCELQTRVEGHTRRLTEAEQHAVLHTMRPLSEQLQNG